MYHEGATLDGPEHSTQPSAKRLQLLQEALNCARMATDLNPNSLSSAALRATLVVNVLVEESSVISSPSALAAAQDDNSCCDRIKEEFREAMAACVKAMDSTQPLLVEPVININGSDQSRTCDPCSLVSFHPAAFMQAMESRASNLGTVVYTAELPMLVQGIYSWFKPAAQT